MPEILAPAVYVAEIPFAAHPIEGVATSTTDASSAAAADRLSEPLSNDRAPDWTAQNQHDPGRTLAELSSWVTQPLAFRTDGPALHAVAAMALHAAAPTAGHERALADQRKPGAVGGASSEPAPNREFADLWLRFESSVAQSGHHDAPGRATERIALSQVVSKYIGETEKNLDAVFTRAEAPEATLLIDEADALPGKRTDVRDSHDRYADQETNDLLQRIESDKGMAILTTSPGDKIDPDALKRLRAEAALPLPPRPGR